MISCRRAVIRRVVKKIRLDDLSMTLNLARGKKLMQSEPGLKFGGDEI